MLEVWKEVPSEIIYNFRVEGITVKSSVMKYTVS